MVPGPAERPSESIEVTTDLITTAAAAIPIVGGTFAGLFQARTNHLTRKELAFLREAMSKLTDRVRSLEDLISKDDIVDLIDHGLDTIRYSTDDSATFHIAAGLVAYGIQNKDRIERAHILLSVFGQLRVDHIRLLREIGIQRNLAGAIVHDRVTSDGHTHKGLKRVLSDLTEVIDPLLAQLLAVGLVYEESEAIQITTQARRPESKWALTEFGVTLLDYLDKGGSSFESSD
jgi:hypothetical protein